MFARRQQRYEYTPEVRRVLGAAGKEAIRLAHAAVGTEHLLLAALREPGATEILRAWGVEPARIRQALESSVVAGRNDSDSARPLGPDAAKALGAALAAARETTAGTVTLAHLLGGVVTEGLAAIVMQEVGGAPTLTVESHVSVAGDVPATLVELDDTSNVPIKEQIVAQITEAVAVGKLAPGERLPAVRQLADMLQIAPGTVARAYSELEARKVVTTDGARGTRISLELGSADVDGSHMARLSAALRPIVVAAFHSGAGSAEVRAALDEAMRGIYH